MYEKYSPIPEIIAINTINIITVLRLFSDIELYTFKIPLLEFYLRGVFNSFSIFNFKEISFLET